MKRMHEQRDEPPIVALLPHLGAGPVALPAIGARLLVRRRRNAVTPGR